MVTASSLRLVRFLGILLGLASLPVRSHVIPSGQHEHHAHGACSQVSSILESFQQATVCTDYPAVEDEFVQPTLEILITKKCYNNLKFDESCLQGTYDKLIVKDRPVFCGGINKITSMIQLVKMTLCALEGGDASDRQPRGAGFFSFLTDLQNIIKPTTMAPTTMAPTTMATTAADSSTTAADSSTTAADSSTTADGSTTTASGSTTANGATTADGATTAAATTEGATTAATTAGAMTAGATTAATTAGVTTAATTAAATTAATTAVTTTAAATTAATTRAPGLWMLG